MTSNRYTWPLTHIHDCSLSGKLFNASGSLCFQQIYSCYTCVCGKDLMCYCSIYRSVEGDYQGVGKKGHANVQMARILQYLECPQYLRKSFFPQHKDLQYAGMYTSSVCL